jgi:hypothetical protein
MAGAIEATARSGEPRTPSDLQCEGHDSFICDDYDSDGIIAVVNALWAMALCCCYCDSKGPLPIFSICSNGRIAAGPGQLAAIGN